MFKNARGNGCIFLLLVIISIQACEEVGEDEKRLVSEVVCCNMDFSDTFDNNLWDSMLVIVEHDAELDTVPVSTKGDFCLSVPVLEGDSARVRVSVSRYGIVPLDTVFMIHHSESGTDINSFQLILQQVYENVYLIPLKVGNKWIYDVDSDRGGESGSRLIGQETWEVIDLIEGEWGATIDATFNGIRIDYEIYSGQRDTVQVVDYTRTYKFQLVNDYWKILPEDPSLNHWNSPLDLLSGSWCNRRGNQGVLKIKRFLPLTSKETFDYEGDYRYTTGCDNIEHVTMTVGLGITLLDYDQHPWPPADWNVRYELSDFDQGP